MNKRILYRELSDDIIKIAIDVQKELGIGFLEKVYENAYAVRLFEENILFEQQKAIKVFFHSQIVGDYFADLVIDNEIIIELKAVEVLLPVHEVQTLTYMKLADMRLGYLINFNVPLIKQGIKRKINGYF